MTDAAVVSVAVPVPLRRVFAYRVAAQYRVPAPGCRVRVPFAGRRMIGVVLHDGAGDAAPGTELKLVIEVLDAEPLFSSRHLDLLRWCAEYYHHPVGEVMQLALPERLRRGEPAVGPVEPECYFLSPPGAAATEDALKRAPLQRRVLHLITDAGECGVSAGSLRALSPRWRPAVRALCDRGWVVAGQAKEAEAAPAPVRKPLCLTTAQARAIETVVAETGGYTCYLLHGVTGSGKTEVYLRVVDAVVSAGAQALILVPEIALTPQLVERFQEYFGTPVAVLHSGLSETARYRNWWRARCGEVSVVLGTRSAVLAPLKRLGVIIVDEEHDGSYKQQDGCRYHARDVAVKRAADAGVPILLGTATPSLETEASARSGRYRRLHLPVRAGSAQLPAIRLVPMSVTASRDGLTDRVVSAVRQRLERAEQCLVFVNRRGFAPLVVCFRCGWRAGCGRCDANLTWHRRGANLRCHHCGFRQPELRVCPQCGNEKLFAGGEGTQRIEEALEALFPGTGLVRIDRDSTARRGEFERMRDAVRGGHARLLVGTQMLSKGHDFPNVTLVCVLNVDQGLFSLDFRATEHLFQQVIQVAGRAGRADKPGEVLIQTYHPENPYFNRIRDHDYEGFASMALAERREAGYPPYAHLALLRAESHHAQAPVRFLQEARGWAEHTLGAASIGGVELMYPVPSPMERKAGRYRAQLLVRANRRAPLHALLDPWVRHIEQEPAARRVRWSLDVDPTDLY